MTAIAELLPHQPPMRLIDAILSHDGEGVWATRDIRPDSSFVGAHGLRACFGLELVAQAAAALLTLVSHESGPPRQGMLIASRSFESNLSYYPLHARLLILARLDSPLPTDDQTSSLVKFAGEIRVFEQSSEIPSLLDELASTDIATRASLSVYL